jgi:cell division septation protein DedD
MPSYQTTFVLATIIFTAISILIFSVTSSGVKRSNPLDIDNIAIRKRRHQQLFHPTTTTTTTTTSTTTTTTTTTPPTTTTTTTLSPTPYPSPTPDTYVDYKFFNTGKFRVSLFFRCLK